MDAAPTPMFCVKCMLIYGMGSDEEPKKALTIHKGEALCGTHLADTVESPALGLRERVRERVAERLNGLKLRAAS